jgi:3',5'-cyclic AMP phosphodiesterase CpdA
MFGTMIWPSYKNRERHIHISDLHRSPHDPISNAELVSALISDRERYLHESPCIAEPNAIVVSGDIIQGVPLGADDHEVKLTAQYAVAEELLDELVRRYRSRLIMIPGNHDVDWNTAFKAMEPVDRKDAPGNLASVLHAENSEYRWDWKTQTLYRIKDSALYERRLEAFWHFFEKFYSGVQGLLKVRTGADANLFRLCDGHVGVAAYNSCHGNDCFCFPWHDS